MRICRQPSRTAFDSARSQKALRASTDGASCRSTMNRSACSGVPRNSGAKKEMPRAMFPEMESYSASVSIFSARGSAKTWLVLFR